MAPRLAAEPLWTTEMMLNTTMILDLLHQRPGRYIQHDMGQYRMKEANGDDVTITETGREYLVEPIAEQMDDLTDTSQLVRDGSKYLCHNRERVTFRKRHSAPF
jgi:virulence-associated protein VagC